MTASENIASQEIIEHKLINLLARRRNAILRPKPLGRCKEHDFELYVPLKIEIKCDFKCEKTGNVFLEVHNCKLGEPSGLAATEAATWVHYIPHLKIALLFNPSIMLDHLVGRTDQFKKSVGDANSNGFVIPLGQLKQLPFVTIEPIDFDAPI